MRVGRGPALESQTCVEMPYTHLLWGMFIVIYKYTDTGCRIGMASLISWVAVDLAPYYSVNKKKPRM